jgi:trans-aconitate 2-methyltransferase
LLDRWPGATVIGTDNDRAMLDAAAPLADDRLRFVESDIDSWEPERPLDVIVANASLQWAPGHLHRLPEWTRALRPGGSLALQVPGNFDDPHHVAIRAQVASEKWRTTGKLASIADRRTHGAYLALDYLDELAPTGASIDAWETTYVHILPGDDPILEWVKGTALRPVLAALDTEEQRDEFCTELGPTLRAAYPTHAWGTPFPFRRVFVVATM